MKNGQEQHECREGKEEERPERSQRREQGGLKGGEEPGCWDSCVPLADALGAGVGRFILKTDQSAAGRQVPAAAVPACTYAHDGSFFKRPKSAFGSGGQCDDKMWVIIWIQGNGRKWFIGKFVSSRSNTKMLLYVGNCLGNAAGYGIVSPSHLTDPSRSLLRLRKRPGWKVKGGSKAHLFLSPPLVLGLLSCSHHSTSSSWLSS